MQGWIDFASPSLYTNGAEIMDNDLLIIKGLSKAYPGVQALDSVDISFKTGEVHAIVGENGAGKSTLIKCISGAITPDSGEFILDGANFSLLSPNDTIQHGIVTVYQELNLIPALSVAENVFVGMKVDNKRLFDRRTIEEKCQKIMDGYSIDIKADALVKDLSAAQRQLVEIVRAISRDVRILILDEPTSSLTIHEADFLFKTIKRLKAEGITIIYISHVLEEIFALADSVTVMRDGKKITTIPIGQTDRNGLINMMVGHEMTETFPQRTGHSDEIVLEAKNISGKGVNDISFSLHRGEILGFAGLVGAGRSELMHMIYGAMHKSSGKVVIEGKETKIKNPHDAISRGLGMIPEDRKLQGVFLRMTIRENIESANLKKLCKFGVMNGRKEIALAESFREKLMIKTPGINQLVNNLSGGNQQKVAVAKAMAPEPKILIFDEPTRGIDVGAKQEIYKLMSALVEQGHSIIMISSEMVELMGMADRIIVLHSGEYAGALSKGEYSQEKILKLASGEITGGKENEIA